MTAFLLALSLSLVQPHERPSVLLVTLDTFRGDYVGEDTPHLAALAARGVRFTRARAPVPLTLPSHASMFTGLYPPEHGVRDNGSFVLDGRHRTLAETLRDEGYETAAFVGSFVLDQRFGLARGFDVYDDATQSDVASLESPEAERAGGEVVAAFERWMEERTGSSPFFAWVHLYDPHAPYEPPSPHPGTYAGEIAYTDALVGRIAAGLPASTLIAVVGDHGEGLGEHGEATHALFIYNATLHVPFLLAGPGVPEGLEVSALVRTIDVPATLLDSLGLRASFGRGETLRALFRGDGAVDDRTAYSESLYGARHFGFAPLFGLETARYHWIDAPRPELYEVPSDPGETRNGAAEQAGAARTVSSRLHTLRDSFGSGTASATHVDDETRARLESLGYVTSTPPVPAPRGEGIDRRDPKDELDVYRRVQLAQLQRAGGECAAVVASLTPLVEALPYPVAVAYETLGGCLLDAGRTGEAGRLYEAALDRGLEDPRFHVELGVIAYREGNLDRAERELRAALDRAPWNVRAHYHLGNVLRSRRRDAEASASYEEAVRLNPSYVYAWNGLGMTLSRRGENDEALEAFRAVVALQPEEPRGHFNLAVQLERMGREEEALPVYRHFLSIAPESEFAGERARAPAATR